MPKRNLHFPRISEEELVVGSLLGDLEAFDELVRRFRGAVTAIAEQVVGSRDTAEDVAQETFLLAFKALPQLEDPTKFAGWLCAIAKRRAWRVSSRERRSEPTEQSELDRLIIANSDEIATHPASEFDRKLERAFIRSALAKLPEEHQIVLRLRYYEEWAVEQIARFLSLPITTVKWRLHHGRKLLKRHLTGSSEVGTHGRNGSKSSGDQRHSSHAERNHSHSKGSEPDRGTRGRCTGFRATVQRKRRIPRAERPVTSRLIPSFA